MHSGCWRFNIKSKCTHHIKPKSAEVVFGKAVSPFFLRSIFQIKEVAPHTTQNQHRLWKHDIRVARSYNTASQTDDDLASASQQSTKQNATNNNKKKDDHINRLYRQCNWSDMNPPYAMYGPDATISDLERISLCMEYPTRPMPMRSQFDTKPMKIQNYKNPNQRSPSSTSPPSPSSSPSYSSKMSPPRVSPSLFANLHSTSKFRLEKIPEVPPPTLPISAIENENQITNNLVPSTDEVK